jgi:hypothetical protein
MKVVLDTPIWSLVLRRNPPDAAIVSEFTTLVRDGRATIIGPIRQEVLSGSRDRTNFERLRKSLGGFKDVEIITADYERAAAFYNECQRHGIQGSHADYLICAVAVRNEFSIFTTDGDFTHYAKVLPITLYDS